MKACGGLAAVAGLGAVLLTLAAAPSLAVVGGITDLSEFSNAASPYNGMNWDYIYYTRGGTSVAIGGFTLLTADHYTINTLDDAAADHDTFAINGDTWAVASVENLSPDAGQVYEPDMRVLHMENQTNPYRPLPGFYDLYTYEGTAWPETEQSFIIAGTGDTGSTASVNYYTDTPDTRALRWGTNSYEYLTRRFSSRWDELKQYSTLTVKMRYSRLSPTTPHESGLGTGDSGAGLFVKDGDTWKLAGIGLSRDTFLAGYRDFYAASIPFYADRLYDTIPEPPTLTGDLDGDGDVDNADIGLAAGNFTGTSGTGMSYSDGDMDGDGDVDNADIGLVAGAFTGAMSSGSPSAVVPEPATLSLLALGGLAVLRRRKR